MSDQSVYDYLLDLNADVLATAEVEKTTTGEVFTRRALDDLEQAGVTENTFDAYHQSRGLEASGYGSSESLDSLDVFVTDYSMEPEIGRIGKSEIEARLTRLWNFVERCREGALRTDESNDVYDMCVGIGKKLPEISRIRLFLLTNKTATIKTLPASTLGDVPVSYEIWDLTRFHRMATSGTLSEPITVEFADPLPCLATPTSGQDFSVYLAILPGSKIAEWYALYGTRLLELNVRSFLQTKGAVNRGIRDTLLTEPDRFIAYNNGITATASKVETVLLPDGSWGISRINELQIVNGGQTTASIHYTHIKDRADISDVFVQMKLTEISPDRLQEIVPEISKYSNTQNKVTLVDFSSNDPYHVEVERITRSLWARSADGSGHDTKWFYERARGQYADALARERTPARQRVFKTIHPLSQKFTKSDAAKYEHSWQQRPYIVSLGAEKNFRDFMIRLKDNPPIVDTAYCERLIAKAILFRTTEKIVTEQGFQGFRANIVTYTIARLAHDAGGRLDLDRIWLEQKLTLALRMAINDLSLRVRGVIANPTFKANVTEEAKDERTWSRVLKIDWGIPAALQAEFIDPTVQAARGRHAAETKSEAAAKLIIMIASIPASVWFALSDWAKETRSLEPWQRRIASDIGKLLSRGQDITYKQAADAEQVMIEAQRRGFRI